MPELPDITLYVDALNARITGRAVERVKIVSPFVVRSFAPPISAVAGKMIRAVSRIGKQIVWELEGGFFLVFHLMIAGRFHWKKPGAAVGGKMALAGFAFPNGTLLLSEASTKKRASIHLLEGKDALASFNRGGLEPLGATLEEFRSVLLRENHTLKRSLTDPRLFSGIGNSYSDEILHRARLSPLRLTKQLSGEEITRLHQAVECVLVEWIDRLRKEQRDAFPEKVTAFRPDMAVHGRFELPCPVCGTAVQRIAYAENECNYCPRCQTGGKLLADRSLSRLLKDDWPATIEEWEEGMTQRHVSSPEGD